MSVLSYLIVGSGYRSEYYARIAKTYPEYFRAMFLCRSEEKAAYIAAKTGVPATTSDKECDKFKADFVVVAVNKESVADVAGQWIARGYPVLLETPAGATKESLSRLWELYKVKGARVNVCEQYHRYPALIPTLKAVKSGRIGTPTSAYISLVHDYHAASLLKKALLVEGEAFTIRGERTISPVVETDSRTGAIFDGRTADKARDVAIVDYLSGKRAVYDFSGVQYRSFIRARHFIVRGERGEISDNILYGLDQDNRPIRDFLMPVVPKKYASLDTQTLRDIRKVWRPELFLDTAQDEFAIATVLYDMKEYLDGGSPAYSLKEGLEDAYFWLLLEEAVSSPFKEVASEKMPWDEQ